MIINKREREKKIEKNKINKSEPQKCIEITSRFGEIALNSKQEMQFELQDNVQRTVAEFSKGH